MDGIVSYSLGKKYALKMNNVGVASAISDGNGITWKLKDGTTLSMSIANWHNLTKSEQEVLTKLVPMSNDGGSTYFGTDLNRYPTNFNETNDNKSYKFMTTGFTKVSDTEYYIDIKHKLNDLNVIPTILSSNNEGYTEGWKIIDGDTIRINTSTPFNGRMIINHSTSNGNKINNIATVSSSYIFTSITDRDTYFGTTNMNALKNGLVSIVKNGTTETLYTWEGEDNPSIYNAGLWHNSTGLIKGETGDTGATGAHGKDVRDVQIVGDDIVFGLKNYETNMIESTTIKDGISKIRSGIVLGNYRGIFNPDEKPLPDTSVLNGQWWKTGSTGDFQNTRLPIGSIIIANKNTNTATVNDFDIYPMHIDEIISNAIYILASGNNTINQVKNIKMQTEENGVLSISIYDGTTNSFIKVGEVGKTAKADNIVVKNKGALFMETIGEDGTVYNLRVVGEATTDNAISVGDASRNLILVAKDTYITTVGIGKSDLVLPYNNLFDETARLTEFSMDITPTKTINVRNIASKSTEDIDDFLITCVEKSNNSLKYSSRDIVLFENKLDKEPKLAGDINFKSVKPFYLLEGVTYTISIKFSKATELRGKTINGKFTPYIVLTYDELQFDRIAGKIDLDNATKKISTDGKIWVKGDSTKNNSIAIVTNEQNKLEFKQLIDSTNGIYADANINDMSIGNYPSVVDLINQLKTGKKYISEYNPNVDTLNIFTNAKAGYYWRVSAIKNGVLVGGISKDLQIGDSLICSKDIVGTPTNLIDFTLEPAPIIAPMNFSTATNDGASGTVPKPLKGTQDMFLNAGTGWKELPIMENATLTEDGKKGQVPIPPKGKDIILYNNGWDNLRPMTGATLTSSSTIGGVPICAPENKDKYLRGDSQWVDPTLYVDKITNTPYRFVIENGIPYLES